MLLVVLCEYRCDITPETSSCMHACTHTGGSRLPTFFCCKHRRESTAPVCQLFYPGSMFFVVTMLHRAGQRYMYVCVGRSVEGWYYSFWLCTTDLARVRGVSLHLVCRFQDVMGRSEGIVMIMTDCGGGDDDDASCLCGG